MAGTLRTRIAGTARTAEVAALPGAVAIAALLGAAVIALPGTAHADPGAVTPDSGHRAAMYGDPASAAPFWRRQTSTDCGEMSVADVVGQVTGDEPTEEQITTVAENTPSAVHSGSIWAPGKYTSNGDLTVLLAHYGVHAAANHGSLEELEQDLANGQKVIVGLNDDTIWNTPGNRTRENHFVVVTGIDPAADAVHLNDSDLADGRDEQVPVATFEAAWATSRNFTVVTTG
jgi:predicted double-glycine peptidase